MPAALRLEGQRFNRWLVVKCVGKDKSGQRLWEAICDCGTNKIIIGHSIKTGLSKSCGCLQLERATTHGMKGTRFYNIWRGMKKRCSEINSPHYKDYGGRGITVCDRWLESFENFRDDMYPSYLEHVKAYGEKDTTIDRIDVNGNYESCNVRWATRAEQNRVMRTSSQTNNLIKHIKNRNTFLIYMNVMLLTGVKNTSLFKYRFGISLTGFRQYIESQFTESISWNNHGDRIGKWEFDHIIECYKFDLSKDEELLKCFHYTNIRPMQFTTNRTRSKISRNFKQEELI